jgi:hypothetical protein
LAYPVKLSQRNIPCLQAYSMLHIPRLHSLRSPYIRPRHRIHGKSIVFLARLFLLISTRQDQASNIMTQPPALHQPPPYSLEQYFRCSPPPNTLLPVDAVWLYRYSRVTKLDRSPCAFFARLVEDSPFETAEERDVNTSIPQCLSGTLDTLPNRCDTWFKAPRVRLVSDKLHKLWVTMK